MSGWHTCTYYCVGKVHAIPVFSDPAWDKAEVLASFVHHADLHPGETVVDLLPAREADTDAWVMLGGWHNGYGEASHPAATDRPWLALIRIPSLPPAPQRPPQGGS